MKPLLTIILILISSFAFGQHSFSYYDSITFSLYEQGRYSELIREGNAALSAGYDSYYLRMRLGIAYYSLNRFEHAYKHFKKAYSVSSDLVSAEYLYYSLIFSGRTEQARLFLCENSELLPEIKDRCKAVVAGVYAEGGVKRSSGEVRTIGDITFFHAGLTHQPGKRWEIYQGYSRVKQELFSYDYIHQGNGPGPGGMDSVELRTENSLFQNEYYARVSWYAGSGISLSPAFHYQGVQGMDNNTAISMRLEQAVPFLRWQVSAGFSQINGLDQQLYSAGAMFYPNRKINAGVEAGVHIQGSETSMVYTARAGVEIFDGFRVEGLYGWGDMYNYPDMHAFYIYNIPDIITSRMNLSAGVRIAGRHFLRGGYLYEEKESVMDGTNYTHSGFYISLTLDLP